MMETSLIPSYRRWGTGLRDTSRSLPSEQEPHWFWRGWAFGSRQSRYLAAPRRNCDVDAVARGR